MVERWKSHGLGRGFNPDRELIILLLPYDQALSMHLLLHQDTVYSINIAAVG
jgi:hypothetical protein